MPTYIYQCDCDNMFEAIAGYEDYTITHKGCGKKANRIPYYTSQGVVFKGAGFTKSVLPPKPKTRAEHQEVNEMLGKEMSDKGYPTERVYDDIRNNRTETKEGHIAVDYSKLPKEI